MAMFFIEVAQVISSSRRQSISQTKVRGDMVIASRVWIKKDKDAWVDSPMTEITVRNDHDSGSKNIRIAEGCRDFKKRLADERANAS